MYECLRYGVGFPIFGIGFWRTSEQDGDCPTLLFVKCLIVSVGTAEAQIFYTMKHFKITFLVLLLAFSACGQTLEKQKEDDSKVDYSQKSNILDPDTLKGDQKKIFWHPYFLILTYKKAESLTAQKMKEEIGITISDRERFQSAYSFFRIDITFHKKSCEQWESFKDLAPKSD